MKFKSIGIFLIVVMTVFFINGYSTSSALATELNITLVANPPTLDPFMTTAVVTKDVATQIFENLITLDEDYNIVPELAEKFEISNDGRTYTFILRQDVVFHNGKKMTAEDVLASINHWQEKLGAAELKLKEANIYATDDYTVVIEIPEPLLDLSYDFASYQYRIMPKEVLLDAGVDGVKELIGTGPYQFVEWRDDHYIHLTKFEGYQPSSLPSSGLSGRKEALVNDIYFRVVRDDSTRLAGIRSGEYDIALQLPNDGFFLLEADPNIETIKQLHARYILMFNKKEGPFANEKIRHAVNAALDVDSIMSVAFGDPAFYRVDHSWMWKEQAAWYNESGKEYHNQKDPEKAKALLNEGGYQGEVVRIMTTRDYSLYYDGAIVLKSQLERIGMKVELVIYDWPTLVSHRPDPFAWDLLLAATTYAVTPTALLSLSPRWVGWFDDAVISEGLNKISTAKSIEEASAIWKEVHGEVWRYLPAVKMGDYYRIAANRKNVEGFQMFLGSPCLWNTVVYK